MCSPPTIPEDRSDVVWTRPVVLLLFFASGATGLVYEIIWVRQLTLVFGVTVFAVSAVLGAFMAGLALGSVAFGRLADARPERALAVYGIIELGIAAYALCLPLLIESVTPVYVWLRAETGAQFWGLSAFKLIAMFVVLLPATVLMGGTYPVMVRHIVREEGAVGRGVGLLYGVNTVGAVAGCFLASFVLIGAYTVSHYWGDPELAFRATLFQVVSILTTTGYGTADYEQWSWTAQFILFTLMFVGGCAGSTGGGMKVYRIHLLLKAVFVEITRLVHPRAVVPVRLGNNPVPREVVANVLGFFVLFMLVFVVGVLVMAEMGLDMATSFGSVAASLGNIGPGLGGVGPTDNYAAIPAAGKWFLTLLMLMGRLEIYTVIVLLAPGTWKR